MKPQLASRVPAVIDGWLALFRAVTEADDAPDGPLKGVQLIDGPVKKMSRVRAAAIVIAAGDQIRPGAMSTLEQQPGLGGQSYVERIETVLSFGVAGGAGDMKKCRDRAAEILGGIKALVDTNQVAPDLWDQAFLGQALDWYPSQNEAGAQVEVDLTVVTRSII